MVDTKKICSSEFILVAAEKCTEYLDDYIKKCVPSKTNELGGCASALNGERCSEEECADEARSRYKEKVYEPYVSGLPKPKDISMVAEKEVASLSRFMLDENWDAFKAHVVELGRVAPSLTPEYRQKVVGYLEELIEEQTIGDAGIVQELNAAINAMINSNDAADASYSESSKMPGGLGFFIEATYPVSTGQVIKETVIPNVGGEPPSMWGVAGIRVTGGIDYRTPIGSLQIGPVIEYAYNYGKQTLDLADGGKMDHSQDLHKLNWGLESAFIFNCGKSFYLGPVGSIEKSHLFGKIQAGAHTASGDYDARDADFSKVWEATLGAKFQWVDKNGWGITASARWLYRHYEDDWNTGTSLKNAKFTLGVTKLF